MTTNDMWDETIKEKIKPVCVKCKSDRVMAADANVEWDVENQRWCWEFRSFGDWYCAKCGVVELETDEDKSIEWVKA